MYFTYVDETGLDNANPVVVMTGIIVNDERLGRTQDELSAILSTLRGITTGHLKELKSRHLLPGTGAWKGVAGSTRRNIVSNICQWLCDRKHNLALSAIDKGRLNEVPGPSADPINAWQAGALHVALQLQRAHQSMEGRKGRTVLVFDDNKQQIANFSDLIYDPPLWTEDYYGRHKKDSPLSMVIDTPFAVKSHQVGLVQVADIFSAVFRHYAELRDYGMPEGYRGELQHYEEWVRMLSPRLLKNAHRWPQRSKSECAQWYRELAPHSLLSIPTP